MSDASEVDEDGVEDVTEESNEKADKTTDDLPESVDLFDSATAGSMIKENHGHTNDLSSSLTEKADDEFKRPAGCTQDKEASPRLHPVEVGR
ncbi:unnamed protein product [Strongylus vulgaris]|uniref:Uncharacterized protein n=1 Tax=Strongylus vulgaris TaxID=40348 RepID=A0A3P7KAY0_STRVU|nr:unnamed protein product [Strongylus vulgaris]